MKKRKGGETGSWVVEMECVVRREVVVEGLTMEQALMDPYQGNVLEERDLETIDFKTNDIRPNV